MAEYREWLDDQVPKMLAECAELAEDERAGFETQARVLVHHLEIAMEVKKPIDGPEDDGKPLVDTMFKLAATLRSNLETRRELSVHLPAALKEVMARFDRSDSRRKRLRDPAYGAAPAPVPVKAE